MLPVSPQPSGDNNKTSEIQPSASEFPVRSAGRAFEMSDDFPARTLILVGQMRGTSHRVPDDICRRSVGQGVIDHDNLEWLSTRLPAQIDDIYGHTYVQRLVM